MDSSFIRHEACPQCKESGQDRSGNNLSIYDDGHGWCFSCGYYQPSNKNLTNQQVKDRLIEQDRNKNVRQGSVMLPHDFTYTIPIEPLTWLLSYKLTAQEIIKNHIGWSPHHERLIFPVFDLYGNLVIWQGRRFSSNLEKPKYSTRGYKEHCFHILGPYGDRVTVVEDMVSAIKIARHGQAMPLWGSSLSSDQLLQLGNRFKHLNIWLDGDKAEYAIKSRQRGLSFFDSVSCTITKKDPKEYSDSEIVGYLGQGATI